jgi:serine/threonine protein kinase
MPDARPSRRDAIPRTGTEGDDSAAPPERESDLTLVSLIREVLGGSRVWPRVDEPRRGTGSEKPASHRIGKFEVLGEIGRGGFGTVLLVRDPDLGRERALKVPNPETLDAPGALARFLGEARLAARVEHPNVVRVYEAETAGLLPYIVMEYCPAGSLGEWLAKRSRSTRLPERWVAQIVAEIADGVEQAHRAGLLHRDLKPANILLEASGPVDGPSNDPPRFRPKIADFGLAKVLEAGLGRSLTASGTPMGTWSYMSPEQARGEKGIGATTDVYAIGAILYELLAGERLYAGLSQTEILNQLLSPEESPRPGVLRKGLCGDLDTICLKCLEKEPRGRYQNPSELANDLRRFLAGLPILARPAPFWRRGLGHIKRHPIRWGLAGVVLAGVLAGAFAWRQYRELRQRGAIDVLLNNLESAPVARLPELISRIDATDARVAARLDRLFREGAPPQKRAAALALASERADCRAYGYDQLLAAEPGEIAPLARILRDAPGNLAARLAAEAETPSAQDASHAAIEAHDRRRAAAAAALVAIDDERGWSLLRFARDPQPRSFLVHLLGPSGVDPRKILGRLASEPDVTIRRALIQSLGEVTDESWDHALRNEVDERLLDLYEHDPDSGVHGAVKWLLGSWRLTGPRTEIDARLTSSDRPIGRSWRIGTPLQLTFVGYKDAGTGRLIEIADTEITVAQILRWRKVPYLAGASPGPDYPINGSTYMQAAEFLNWLSSQDGIAGDQFAYQRGKPGEPPLVPADNQLDRVGYRLLTDREFEQACRAGTSTSRYYGTSSALLSRYAWYGPPVEVRSNPVGRLKPNDLGLFDMLGNVAELCQASEGTDPWTQVVACDGSVLQPEYAIKSDARTPRTRVEHSAGSNEFGFRVARTVRPQE